MSVIPCDICGRPSTQTALRQICNIDVCTKCFRGDLSKQIESRGWKIDVNMWEVQAQGVIRYVEVTCTRKGGDVPIKASFRPEHLPQKAIKLFKREIQVGEPEFDDAIYISTDTPELTAKLLEQKGVKGAIMALVANGGQLRIADDNLQFSNRTKKKITAKSVHLSCCVLLHFIEALMVAD